MNHKSISLTDQVYLTSYTRFQLTWLILLYFGLAILFFSIFELIFLPSQWALGLSFTLIISGTLGSTLMYENRKKITGQPLYTLHGNIRQKKWSAWLLALLLTAFYVLLYLQPELLGLKKNSAANSGLIGLYDGLSYWIKGKPASEWFVYGILYTLAITTLGIRVLFKFKHNHYQVYRTLSIIFFQLIFAFLLPEILQAFNKPYVDLKNFWPLNYYFFFDWNIDQLLASGQFGFFILGWGTFGFLVLTPLFTYYFGKRWYCSWVCGCGGLAETVGDEFRHLSNKSKKAWQLEKYSIYSILVLVVVMTLLILISRFTGQLTILSQNIAHWYGLIIGAMFSGIIGVGFYPLLGGRVWCRFGCPMAAYLGLLQKMKSRFRISTNGGQCISCGNCSTYCEMGIDVKSYAQQGKDIVRASCVGCGICSAVCPRGVLKLENIDK